MATNVISPKPIDNRKELRVKLDPDLVEALNATQMLFESHGFVLHTEDEITARVRSYLAKVLKTAPTLDDFPSAASQELERILQPLGIKPAK